MESPIKKVGIIQTAPLPGDFSTNLRNIVQGYRHCLDHGAELVIASAYALCGTEPRHLVNRQSFIRQTRAALDTLSHELGDAPLLLGAYTPMISEDELWEGVLGEEEEGMEMETDVVLAPFLIEKDLVEELEDGEVNQIQDWNIFINIGDDEDLLPDSSDFDLLVHMSRTPWYTKSAENDEESCQWEARTNGVPVICCRSVGTAGGHIYGGGSGVYSSAGKTLLRLPFFETASQTASLNAKPMARSLPTNEQLLRQALERGIRDTVRNNGYGGVCIPLDHPSSTLLAALAVSALGSSNVDGITFEGNTAVEKVLGITCKEYKLEEMLESAQKQLGDSAAKALKERLKSAMMSTHAEERGLMLLSPLNRHEIMTGKFTLYGESCGYLAPLGNLYHMDIYLLSKELSEHNTNLFGTIKLPDQPEQDRIIHELADRNISPSDLINKSCGLFKENDVRFIQRKIIASALKRTQLPIVLRVDAPEEQLSFPISHRLND